MAYMDQEHFEQYQILNKQLDIAATNLLKRYQEIRHEVLGDRVLDCLNFVNLEDDELYFRGTEWGKYQTHDDHELYILSSYLYDPDVEIKIRRLAELEKEERQRRADIQHQKTIDQEKQQLEELRRKYEQPQQ